MEEKKNKINKTKISVVLGIMCFALALGICIQIRTVKNSNSTVSSNYEENNYLMYELELELYEDINNQNKAVSNQFIFKVVANIPMKLNTMLVFPEPYKKNNEKSSIEFYNAPPKADLTY